MTAPMTPAEVDRALSKLLGWDIKDKRSAWHHKRRLPSGEIAWLPKFSPSTSSDHLRLYVLPEIKRRGLAQAFMDKCIRPENCLELGDEEDTYGWWLLNASPSVLARAALDILRKATKW